MSCKNHLTYSAEWTADELNFIDIIKKYPRIYKFGIYKKSVKDLWDAVALEYGESVKVCQKRWFNIKAGYIKQKKMEQPERRQKKSKYIDGTLSFLDDSMAVVGDSRRKYNIKKKKSNKQNKECLPLIEDETLEPEHSNGSFTKSASDTQKSANNPCQIIPNIEPFLISTPKSSQMTNITRINPIQEQSQRTQTTTVLTQDIIGYILKSKSDDELQSNDLFQSIASVVSDQVLLRTNMIQTNASNVLSSSIQDSQCTIQQAIPLRQATYAKSYIGLSNDSHLREDELHDEEDIEDIIIKEEICTETDPNSKEYEENEITIGKSDNEGHIGYEIIEREIKEEEN